MKIKYLILALLPFSIVACQSVHQNSAPVTVNAEKQMNANKILSAYTWSYQPEGTLRPIQLNFSENRLNIITGCNNQGGSWKVENQKLITSSLVSTMKACEPALMKNEQFSSNLFNDQQNKFELNTASVEQPRLTIIASNGQKYEFEGSMTPETKYQSQGEIIFLEISPETKQCTGVYHKPAYRFVKLNTTTKALKLKSIKTGLYFMIRSKATSTVMINV